VEIVQDDIFHLKGRFPGPQHTPYEGGTFQVDVIIPETYPFKPPIIKFDTNVYHPNISSQTGVICLDILKDAWSPALSIKAAIVSVQALLSSPEPLDPQDAQVANHYLTNRQGFNETAKFWTEVYATDKGQISVVDEYEGVDPEKFGRICTMGFPKKDVIRTLKMCNGEEETTITMLLDGS